MLNTYYGPVTMSCTSLFLLHHFRSPFLTWKTGPSLWALLPESQICSMSTSRGITGLTAGQKRAALKITRG